MKRLNLIVAACDNQGIGKNGKLPWNLKNEMKYFNNVTTSVIDSNKMNAVIMGRITWESIPNKFRPMPKRINIIITSTLSQDDFNSTGVYIFNNLNEALAFTNDKLSDKVEEIFVIGGTSMYQEALNSSYPLRLYYTRIFESLDCDTFFPVVAWDQFKSINHGNMKRLNFLQSRQRAINKTLNNIK